MRDDKTNECFRADKLLEDAIDAFLLKAGITMPAEEQEAHRIIQVLHHYHTFHSTTMKCCKVDFLKVL